MTCLAYLLHSKPWSVLLSAIWWHLRRQGVISKEQHGFLSGMCTDSNLLECLNVCILALRDRSSVTVSYIDFAKAFDSVSHRKLCHRSSIYDISGDLYCLLANFLSGRLQCTRVTGIGFVWKQFIQRCNSRQNAHILFHPSSYQKLSILTVLTYVIGQAIYIVVVVLLLLFSSPNLSRRRLDVYHTFTHGVA